MVVNLLAPSRHIGLGASYHHNWLLLLGGVFFQAVDDLEERTFSKDNNKDYGMDEGYSMTGRLVLNPFYKHNDRGIHLAAAGSYRTPKTDAERPGTIRYSTRSLSNINRKKYLDTDLIGDLNYATLAGVELAGYYKNFRVQGEYLYSGVHRKNDLETLKYDGFYAFASWMIFGGKYNYDAADGEFTQVGRGKKWGDIELALRYDFIDMNNFNQTIIGGSAEGYTVGLNYYANNNVKIMLNYSFLNHDRYASGKNVLYVGYDANGELTKNPRLVADPAGEAGDDYHQISLRIEVDF
jgi:phosphate-selective porin OprO/OprP